MRKIIIVLSGVAILIGGFYIKNLLISNKKAPRQKVGKVEKTAFITVVENGNIPIQISANGKLIAKNKVQLFSEVQGVLEYTGKEFRPGIKYKKGQTILKINAEEHFANLQAQKSNLQNLIAAILPDIRLDYPESFDNWVNYLKSFDIHKSISKLPEPKSDQEKYFVTGKNIFLTYYNVKNLEARYLKYKIRAPFNGILTEVNVTTGALVRSGQKMGEFIDPSIFEVEIAINAGYADILEKGKKVTLTNLKKTNVWEGKVTRINARVDQRTQTVTIYIDVKGKNLREGMYLEANVPARNEKNAFRIERKLLVDNKAIYIVEDEVLKLRDVNIVHFDENSAIIVGLEDGTKVLTKAIPGAFNGMKVKLNK